MNRCNKWITYWHITLLHVFAEQGQMCILTDHPKYATEIQLYTKYALENRMGIYLFFKFCKWEVSQAPVTPALLSYDDSCL